MQGRRRGFLLTLGAAFGSSAGVALGVVLGHATGLGLDLGLAVGVLGGTLIGLFTGHMLGRRAPAGDDPPPTLALVMIVRDEEKLLPRAVASVREYVDEIVIAVDSRTTDGTREAVPGARVFDVEFQDFAQMRTTAMRAAKSDWILVLDADETLEGDPRPLMRKRAIWKLPRRHWMDLERTTPAPDDRLFPDRQRRLFPNDPRVRVVRPLHELVVGIRVRRANHPLLHHFKHALRPAEVLDDRRRMYADLKERGMKAGFRFGPND